jgi:hypothetical protein
MKAYKGFNKDMTCRGFQFEEGKEYHEDNAELCESGFHACENPLDCFNYYSPADSVYHEVELDELSEKKSDDSKICGKHIKIGARLNILNIANLAVEYINSKIDDEKKETNTGDCSAATNTGDCSAASNTGNYSAATNTGDCSAASNTGNYSAATNTGECSAASNTGNYSAASNTGNYSAATNTGECSAASNTGNYSAATNTGDCSAATNTGDCSAATNTGYQSAASVEGRDSVAISTGIESKAKASLGSAICICERGEWNGETYPLLAIKAAIIDGERIKPDTWYTLKNGEFVEVEE